MHKTAMHWAVALLLVGVLPAAGPARAAPPAASEPDTRTMIEALMPTATRGLRNLLVRQKPDEAASGAAAARESASAPAAVASAPAGPAPSLLLAIQFEANSARVRPESGPVLGSLVAAMQSPELKTTRFLIEGHADATGQAASNLRLSQERADEVRLYLVALGVHPARLRAVGKGTSQPANPLDPQSAENRRVRVVTVE